MVVGSQNSMQLPEPEVAIVTGASTGIGRAVAHALGEDGYAVLVNSKTDIEGGEQTVAQIASRSGTAQYCQADVSSVEGAGLVLTSAAKLGRVTVLVNNAGATRGADLGSWTRAHWHDMLDTNLLSTALMSQAFLDVVDHAAPTAIVNIASIRGLPDAPRIGIAAYCAAKAGVITLTKAMAMACAPLTTVNAISPGFVETAYMDRADPHLKALWQETMPINRFIDPTEIAAIASFLVRQRAITGANIIIDGGWTITRS